MISRVDTCPLVRSELGVDLLFLVQAGRPGAGGVEAPCAALWAEREEETSGCALWSGARAAALPVCNGAGVAVMFYCSSFSHAK